MFSSTLPFEITLPLRNRTFLLVATSGYAWRRVPYIYVDQLKLCFDILTRPSYSCLLFSLFRMSLTLPGDDFPDQNATSDGLLQLQGLRWNLAESMDRCVEALARSGLPAYPDTSKFARFWFAIPDFREQLTKKLAS